MMGSVKLTRKQTLYGRAAHMIVLTAWFLDKSNASSFASAASRPRFGKSMSVCSGWMPQREMICGISETIDRMASAPSPSELLSRLRWRRRGVNGALTQIRTLWGSGALEVGDLRLLEDGSKRRGALSSNIVEAETAKEGQSRNVAGEQVCQRALTRKANTWELV